MNILELRDKIYFQKTKDYFKEVEKSFYDENYRSATVMLYSVIITDIIYKLEELSDTYEDKVAKSILLDMKKAKEEDRTNSQWELNLINQVSERTDMIEGNTFSNLKYLKELRNFSAHPAFNNENELIAPNREIIAGLIIEMLEQILTRPPMYASKITDLILNDIAEKKGIFINDNDGFRDYLNSKYLSRMTLRMKMEIFKAFWKLVFALDNDECNENRRINFNFIKIIMQDNKIECLNYIKKNTAYFNKISSNNEINRYLIEFMYYFPEIYELKDNIIKTTLELIYIESPHLNIISYYRYNNVESFIESIDNSQFKENEYIHLLEEYIEESGESIKLYDKYIEIFRRSTSYDEADRLFSNLIVNNLEKMKKYQIISLIEAIDFNNQLYSRYRAYFDNNRIIEKTASILGSSFDYNKYENFKFSKEILDNKLLLC